MAKCSSYSDQRLLFIAVLYYDGSPGGGEKLGGKFGEHNSPIVREITGEGDLNIDLSKPEG